MFTLYTWLSNVRPITRPVQIYSEINQGKCCDGVGGSSSSESATDGTDSTQQKEQVATVTVVTTGVDTD